MKTNLEFEQQALEADKWRDYYKAIAEVHLAELEDLQAPINKILIAKGVMVEIESDLVFFLKSKPATEKSKQQEVRIGILNDLMSYFEKIAMTNVQMKYSLRKAANDLHQEKLAHHTTKQELILVNNIINEE